MAGEPKFKGASHSKTLFTDESNAPRIFFMRPCSERQFLRPLIEHGGGKITSKARSGCIKLAEKGCKVTASDFITTDFIEDCVKMNKYLEPSDYSIPPGTVVREESQKSFSSDDSMSPASTIIKTTIRSCKGRTKYTKEEDLAIINYLVTERRYRETSGMRLWKDMELLGVTSHSADSMNTRYRKNILPNIENYRHEISPKWISLLTGNIIREKEPEFSAEALFKPKSKQVTTHSKKQAEDGTTTSQYFSKLAPSENGILPAKEYQQTLHYSRLQKLVSNNSNDKARTNDQNKTNMDAEFENGGSKIIAKSNERLKYIKEKEMRNSPKKKNADADLEGEVSESEEIPSIMEAKQLRKRPQKAAADQGSSNKIAAFEKAKSGGASLMSLKEKEIRNSPKKKHSDPDLERGESEAEKLPSIMEARQLRKRPQRATTTDQVSPSKIAAVEKAKPCESLKSVKEHEAEKSPIKNTAKRDLGHELESDVSDMVESRKLRSRPQRETIGQRSPSKVSVIEMAFSSRETCNIEKSSPQRPKSGLINSEAECESPKSVQTQVNGNKQSESHKSNDEQCSKGDKLPIATKCLNMDRSSSSKSNKGCELERKKRLDLVLKRIDEHGNPSSDEPHDKGKCVQLINGARKPVTHSANDTPKTNSGKKGDSDNNGKEEKHEGGTDAEIDTEADGGMDSFDQMLAGLAKRGLQKRTDANKVIEKEETKQTIKQISHLSETVTNAADNEARITRARQKAKQQTCKGPADSTTHNVFSFDSDVEDDEDDDEDEEIIKCRKLFRGIAKQFRLPSDYVRKLLHRNNGHVNRTVCWIKFGPYSPWPPSWSDTDDHCLANGEEHERLIAKFGTLDIADRMKFLGFC